MTRTLTLDDLTRLQVPTDPTISPDGRHVVYVLRSTLGDEDVTKTVDVVARDADSSAAGARRTAIGSDCGSSVLRAERQDR